MAIVSLDKSIWSEFILTSLYNQGVYTSISNRDFQGDAEKGKSVKINTLGDLTIGKYTASVDMTMTEASFTSQSINIDQQDYIFEYIDQLYQRQYDVDFMEKLMVKVSDQFRNSADSYMASLYTSIPVNTTNYVNSGSVWTIGKSTETAASSSAMDAILKLNQKLDENYVPNSGRFTVVPPFFLTKLFGDTNYTTLQNGFVQNGNINGTQLYVSNNVAKSGNTYKIIAGTSDSIAFVDVLDTLQIIVPEKRVGSAIKALYVYGGGIVKPTKMAVLNAVVY
jgi:hypothetical protein